MAGSILRSFVSGTRQVLGVQLFVSVGAVALAGWTLAVTNEALRERDRLRERVIQLEEEMGTRGIVVPSPPPLVDAAPAPPQTAYPDEVGPEDNARAPEQSSPPEQTGSEAFNPGQIVTDLFAPPPAMRTLVLHARSEADAELARRLAEAMPRPDNLRIVVRTMAARDPRPSGYTYYDGRQSRTAAALAARFNQTAGEHQIAPWSAQLRGMALPAQGEYTPDRTDIVLPPLPAPAQLNRVDPRLLRERPQQNQPPIR